MLEYCSALRSADELTLDPPAFGCAGAGAWFASGALSAGAEEGAACDGAGESAGAGASVGAASVLSVSELESDGESSGVVSVTDGDSVAGASDADAASVGVAEALDEEVDALELGLAEDDELSAWLQPARARVATASAGMMVRDFMMVLSVWGLSAAWIDCMWSLAIWVDSLRKLSKACVHHCETPSVCGKKSRVRT